jgi:hypothetical protein
MKHTELIERLTEVLNEITDKSPWAQAKVRAAMKGAA